MRDRAADGAAVAGARVADVRQDCASERRMRRAVARSAWRTSAPTRTVLLSPVTSSSPATRFRSTRRAGRSSRMFSSGTRLCPPARTFASSPCSASERNRLVERLGAHVLERRRLHAGAAPRRAPGVSGSSTSSTPERVGDRVRDRDRGAHRRSLAEALRAERRERRRRLEVPDPRRGKSGAVGAR